MLSNVGPLDVERVLSVDSDRARNVTVGAIELDMSVGLGNRQRDVVASPHAAQSRRGTGRASAATPARQDGAQNVYGLREAQRAQHDRLSSLALPITVGPKSLLVQDQPFDRRASIA